MSGLPKGPPLVLGNNNTKKVSKKTEIQRLFGESGTTKSKSGFQVEQRKDGYYYSTYI